MRLCVGWMGGGVYVLSLPSSSSCLKYHRSVGLITLSSLAVAAEKLPGLLRRSSEGASCCSASPKPKSGSENIGLPVEVAPEENSAARVALDIGGTELCGDRSS
jgi:hypothetical protein